MFNALKFKWTEITIKDAILDLAARLSSRVFQGEEVCRNEDWLKITKEYTVDSFKAASMLRAIPRPLRIVAHWLSSDCGLVRRELSCTREIISPVIANRRLLKAQAQAEGKPIPFYNDATDWAETEANGRRYDPATLQLVLSFAAIHTRTDLLAHTLILLADDPILVDALRLEMVEVLRTYGWQKAALYNLKLLDSALQESQPVKPNGMRELRSNLVDLSLNEDVTIRKGQRVCVDGYNMMNPEINDQPEKYDAYCFLRMRDKPGFENKAHLVATSPDHMSFSHGQHACPGRFFAANEMKVALCYFAFEIRLEASVGLYCGSGCGWGLSKC
ncbi:hypothetical protein APSETT444_010769 [Aspergillus pseudonomiae]